MTTRVFHRVFLAAMVPLLLAAGPAAGQDGAAEAKAWAPLLGRLPADADLVLMVDLREAARTVTGLLDAVGTAPVVARHPGLKAQWARARSGVDASLADLKQRIGIDVLADLDRGVLGVCLGPGKARLVALAQGRLAAAKVDRYGPDGRPADRKTRKGAASRSVTGLLPDGVLFALEGVEPAAIAKPAGGPPAAAARHPALGAPLRDRFLLRLSLVLTPEVAAKAVAGARTPVTQAVLDLDRLALEVDADVTLRATARTDAGALRYGSLAEAVREAVAGCRSLARAVVLGAMGLDFQDVGGIPPVLVEALSDTAALQATLDGWLGTGAPQAEVAREGRAVTLRGPRASLAGLGPLTGAMAAVAVPSFVKYLRRAKLSEAHVHVRQIAMAEDGRVVETGGPYEECGPVPREPPEGDPVPWPGDPCFDRLGFRPDGPVRFSYQVRRTPAGTYEVRAVGRLGGPGLTVVTLPLGGGGVPVESEE